MHWTIEQILALAPDPNSAKRGQGLATSRKWMSLETNGLAVWGYCKSSGTAHYETAIDLKGPAFKCTCPSRKFPCKHAIGLLLLASSESDGFKISDDIPDDVQKWLDKREAKPKKSEKTEEELKKAEEKKLKAFNDRIALMQKGIKDLENWLNDMMRIGLASVEGAAMDMTTTRTKSRQIESSSEVWNSIAKRMVDAKLSGLGRRIRELAMIQNSGIDWPAKLLSELSNLHLIIKGFQQLELLPNSLQKELLSMGGVNTTRDQLLGEKGIEDLWMIIGQVESNNIDNAAVRRTWFLGQETGRFALVLEYDYRNDGFPFHWPKGRVFKGEMIYYPSISPLRAMMKNHEISEHIVDGWGGHEDVAAFLNEYSEALGKNPWLEDYPAAFSNVVPLLKDDKVYIVDKNEHAIPLLNIGFSNWKILALSGGNPIDIFGEWTGEMLSPLGIAADFRFVAL